MPSSNPTRGSGPLISPTTARIIRIAVGLSAAYLVVAFLIYRLESLDDQALIKSYPQALWYTLVTVSTVGYGDLYPVSTAGKLLASLLIVASAGFIGYVVGKFGELAVERNRRKFLGMDGTTFTGHYIVIGWNELSRIVIKEMMAAGFNVAALTSNEQDIVEMRSIFPDPTTFFVTFGLAEDDATYDRVNIQAAAGAILLTGDDTTTLITVLELKRLNAELKITAHIANSQLKKTIENAGVNYVISPNEVVGRMIASATFEPDVSHFLEDILSTTTGDDDLDIQEFQLRPGHELAGRLFREIERILEEQTGARLLTYSRKIEGNWRLAKNVPAETVLQPDDYLIVLANHSAATKTSQYLGVGQGRRG